MGELSARPLACIGLAFAVGIAAMAAAGWAWIPLAVAAFACSAAWCATRSCQIGGVALLAIGACAGTVVLSAAGHRSAWDVSQLPRGGQTLVGTVAAAPRYSRGWWRFVLDAEAHEAATGRERLTGRLYVRLRSPGVVRRGQRWRLTGELRPLRAERNPGGRSEAARLASLGVRSVLTVGTHELAQSMGEGKPTVIASHVHAAQWRALQTLKRHVRGPYRELTAAVAGSVIFGVHATPPPPEVSDAFRRAGTIHLLVVSGAMVATVFGLVFLPGAIGAGWRRLLVERQSAEGGLSGSGRGRVRVRPGIAAAVAAVLLASYYAVLTEGGQAVARAAITGGLVGLALMLRRLPAVARQHGLHIDHYTLLAIAGLVILVARPQALFQPGFQLSFAAVWAIIYLTPKAEAFLGWLPRWLRLGLAGTLAAQLATFPILACHYQQAPIAGFVANLLAVPLAGVVLIAGMATCGLGIVAPWLAQAAGWITGISARALVSASSAFASLPWASPEVPRPGWAAIIGWYTGMLALGWWMGRLGERSQREERG